MQPNDLHCVRYEKRDRVAYITLDRPEKLNALSLRMHESLRRVWDDFEGDRKIRAGVLTGAGDKAFSVGQDLGELLERIERGEEPSSFGSADSPGYPRLTERFSMTKPLVARVNGYAMGGGFELAMACDLIVAAEHAQFALPEAGLGLIPGAGGVFRLTRQVPMKAAMGLLLTGRRISAARAFALGIVNEVVPAGELDAATDRWVDEILRCSPASLRAIKDVVASSMHLSLPDAFAAHYEGEERRRRSGDCSEGPRAFAEKRAPRWEDDQEGQLLSSTSGE